jgi:hypothetical protein
VEGACCFPERKDDKRRQRKETPTKASITDGVIAKRRATFTSKTDPTLERLLGWFAGDPRATGRRRVQTPACFMLNAAGKVRGEQDFIYYNQKKSAEGSAHWRQSLW